MEERIKQLEEKVAALEVRVQEQPSVKNIAKKLHESLERTQSFNSSAFKNKE